MLDLGDAGPQAHCGSLNGPAVSTWPVRIYPETKSRQTNILGMHGGWRTLRADADLSGCPDHYSGRRASRIIPSIQIQLDACDGNERPVQRDMLGIVNWTGGRTDRVNSHWALTTSMAHASSQQFRVMKVVRLQEPVAPSAIGEWFFRVVRRNEAVLSLNNTASSVDIRLGFDLFCSSSKDR
ncbi:hypothetical protein BU25DRAFT_406769 [Macroventuria anomochaeta]|uniref:Uncharacterized protein n=1 Tax=Macroventuria anomochaeta TaxID=301207 RepID=A0ACB6SE44_9PLEO|nr:uncharacterized protein BU25DRAFT_406769 [Macroventuria anomochaeta]KAF2632233.1 hypothetical protein BU25DRAFT_406769 [Macroventuria anomochaeta]